MCFRHENSQVESQRHYHGSFVMLSLMKKNIHILSIKAPTLTKNKKCIRLQKIVI